MDGYAALIETMREVRELPGLEFEGCHSLDTLLAHHSQFHETRSDIDRHLDRAAEALNNLTRLNQIIVEYRHLTPQYPRESTRCRADRRPMWALNNTSREKRPQSPAHSLSPTARIRPALRDRSRDRVARILGDGILRPENSHFGHPAP